MARSTIVTLIWLLQCSLGTKYEGCESPQYLEYGKSGVIDCFFHENFTSIFWYDSTNIVVDEPIVTLINSIKGGQGYISGKFDISSNGSLIITDVGVGHGKNFTVAKFVSLDLDGDPMIFVVSAVIKGVISDECDSPQYLEYGRNGTLQCLFQRNFVSLLWYNSTDTVVEAPIVTYTQSVKSGRGFESGEFDIFSNGSLVIHEVGLVHEHNYKVAKFTDLNEEPTILVVRVIVTVKSLLEGPVIDKCESNNTICFTKLDNPSAVNCIVRGVRPAVSLKWLTLTGSGDRNISSKMSSISNNVTVTSRSVTMDAFAYSPVLSLLVCKAEFAPGVLQRDKSLVLVQNSQRNLSSIPPVVKYVPLGSALELHCAGKKIPHLQVVWKRSLSFDNQYQNLMFAVFTENRFEYKYNDHVQFGEYGSLILRQVDPHHDGFYGCIYGDGITDGMTKYEVVTYVHPVPSYPVIEGCTNKSRCVLEVNWKGNLTCSVTGIRPEITLMWSESNTTPPGKITFFESTTTITESGGTFNITLTSSYSIISESRVTVKCGASGPGSDNFPSHSFADLLCVPAKEPDDSSVPTRNHRVGITVIVLTVVCLVCGMSVIISGFRCRKRREEAFSEDCELDELRPVLRSNKGNQSSSGKFAGNEETPEFHATFDTLSEAIKEVGKKELADITQSPPTKNNTEEHYTPASAAQNSTAPLEITEAVDTSQEPPMQTIRKNVVPEEKPKFFSKTLSKEWRSVGRRLGIRDSKLQIIEQDSESLQEAFYNMLIHWKQTRGPKVSFRVLLEALGNEERKIQEMT